MSDKIYIGNGKQSKFGVKLSFSKKDLETMQANLNSKGYINLNLNERKTPGKYGETHSMTVDTWQPKEFGAGFPESRVNISQIPF